MMEQLLGEETQTREAHAEAIATAVSAGALPSGATLPPGASPAERAALAVALADRDGAGTEADKRLAQAKASKEILLKQLIELSDQLARSRTDADAVEAKLGAVQARARRPI